MTAGRLESDRLYLTPVTSSHCNENYLSWFNDTEATRYIESAKQKMTIESLKDFVRKNNEEGNLFWAIHLKENNKHIGNIKIDQINKINGSAEYGILIGDKDSWGKGLAKETSVLVINYCFSQLRLKKITLGLIDGNERALKLYKNLGFEIETVLKSHGTYDGSLKDALRLYLLKDKWKF